MLERLDALSKTIAIDFGTDVTRIWVRGSGLVSELPTHLAVDTTSQRILAIGEDAQAMSGRTAANVQLFRPVQQGQLWDAAVGKAFLQAALKGVLSKSFLSPTLVLSMPATLRPAVEQELVKLGYALGAREVLTVAQPLAAAIGAGMPVADASGGFILQLGAGVAEAAVISLGTLVGVEGTKKAGEQFQKEVILALKASHQVVVSKETAKKLIHQLASLEDKFAESLLITGKNDKTAAPKEVQITTVDLKEPAMRMADSYVELVKQLLTKVPTELTVDIVDKGLLLAGGGAQLRGLDEYLVPKLGVPVSTVEEPDQAVIRGMGTILDHLDEFRKSLSYQE